MGRGGGAVLRQGGGIKRPEETGKKRINDDFQRQALSSEIISATHSVRSAFHQTSDSFPPRSLPLRAGTPGSSRSAVTYRLAHRAAAVTYRLTARPQGSPPGGAPPPAAAAARRCPGRPSPPRPPQPVRGRCKPSGMGRPSQWLRSFGRSRS